MNVGKVPISEKLLLDWLQFQGGKLRYIKQGDIESIVELVIEHPSMPETHVGSTILTVIPQYTKHYGENGCLISVERTHPSKETL